MGRSITMGLSCSTVLIITTTVARFQGTARSVRKVQGSSPSREVTYTREEPLFPRGLSRLLPTPTWVRPTAGSRFREPPRSRWVMDSRQGVECRCHPGSPRSTRLEPPPSTAASMARVASRWRVAVLLLWRVIIPTPATHGSRPELLVFKMSTPLTDPPSI